MFASINFEKGLSILIRFCLFLIAVYLYSLAIDHQGGLDSGLFFSQSIELFILFYFYVYFYLILRPVRFREFIAALPLLAFYFLHDIFFHVYGKIFRLINLSEVPELIQVIPMDYGMILTVFVILPFIILFSYIQYRNIRIILSGALLPFIVVISIFAIPQSVINFLNAAGNPIIEWSDAESVESNGRYTMLLYREAQRQYALAKTNQYRDRAQYEKDINTKVKNLKKTDPLRNVHLIVLESFLDPHLLKQVQFNRNPTYPAFERFFRKNLGLSISPVFAGSTAQAEFELLCGLPALEKLSSMEFNVFTGSPVYCLPGILRKLGYRTLVSNAYKPNYFNSLTAYKGIGFDEIYFPEEYSAKRDTYFNLGEVSEEYYLFDGWLFQQNLNFLAKTFRDDDHSPVFNYLMTSYGHAPHYIDIEKRPEIIQIKSEHNVDDLRRSINQFYYRTQAIINYVKELIKLDNNSLIILISDHLPPLANGPDSYQSLQYLNNIENSHYYNRLMIIENGTPVIYNTIKHYDLPDVIYNYISKGNHCREKSCPHLDKLSSKNKKELLEKYLILMAHASE